MSIGLMETLDPLKIVNDEDVLELEHGNSPWITHIASHRVGSVFPNFMLDDVTYTCEDTQHTLCQRKK
jgi:hypothetical protein